MYENYEGGLATDTMSTTCSCKKQYDNAGACHNKRNGGKLHGNISRNGYGNAIIGRYGGLATVPDYILWPDYWTMKIPD